jgi:hypothetical protein
VAPEVRPRDRLFDCPDYEPQQGAFGFGGSSFAAEKARLERQYGGGARDQLFGICADYRESPAEWSAESFAALKAQIERQVPTRRRDTALKRIATLDPAKPLPDGQGPVRPCPITSDAGG